MKNLSILLTNYRTQGAVIVLLLLTGVVWLFQGPAAQIFERVEQKQSLEYLINRHENQLLNGPHYEVNDGANTLLASASEREIPVQLTNIQNQLSAIIRNQGARILEQRILPNNTSLEGLTKGQLRFQWEGDLQNIISVFDELYKYPEPLFIERLDIMPSPAASGRTDSRLRVLMDISRWYRVPEEVNP